MLAASDAFFITFLTAPRRSVIGQTASKAPTRSSRDWDEASFFSALEGRVGKRELSTCRAIFDWAGSRGLKIDWGKGGKDGSYTVHLLNQAVVYSLIRAYTYGRIEVLFETLKNQPPFKDEVKRQELRRRLEHIPGVRMETAQIDKRPSISLETLAQGDAVSKLCEALEWAIEEATRNVSTGSEKEKKQTATPQIS
jgi:hypothetical protein